MADSDNRFTRLIRAADDQNHENHRSARTVEGLEFVRWDGFVFGPEVRTTGWLQGVSGGGRHHWVAMYCVSQNS